MRSAQVIDGIVTDIAIGVIDGWVPCDNTVKIGWGYDGESFIDTDIIPADGE